MSVAPAFALIETLAAVDGEPRHLDRHLARLARSARELGFALDAEAARTHLTEEARRSVAAETKTDRGGVHADLGAGILRLQLERDGSFALTTRPLTVQTGPVRLAIDSVPVDPDAVIVRHKTTDRAHLDAARERHPGADDVIVLGRDGRVAETTIANLAVRVDGAWVTPPVPDGCLPGIGREIALADGRVSERSITVDELRAAEAIALVSSVRGWREARLLHGARA